MEGPQVILTDNSGILVFKKSDISQNQPSISKSLTSGEFQKRLDEAKFNKVLKQLSLLKKVKIIGLSHDFYQTYDVSHGIYGGLCAHVGGPLLTLKLKSTLSKKDKIKDSIGVIVPSGYERVKLSDSEVKQVTVARNKYVEKPFKKINLNSKFIEFGLRNKKTKSLFAFVNKPQLSMGKNFLLFKVNKSSATLVSEINYPPCGS